MRRVTSVFLSQSPVERLRKDTPPRPRPDAAPLGKLTVDDDSASVPCRSAEAGGQAHAAYRRRHRAALLTLDPETGPPVRGRRASVQGDVTEIIDAEDERIGSDIVSYLSRRNQWDVDNGDLDRTGRTIVFLSAMYAAGVSQRMRRSLRKTMPR